MRRQRPGPPPRWEGRACAGGVPPPPTPCRRGQPCPSYSCRCIQVEIDLALSAHANARAYYDSRRKHQASGCMLLSMLPSTCVGLPQPAPDRMHRLTAASAPLSARAMHGLQTKQQKTLDANQRALKAAEKKAQQQLKQVRDGGGGQPCGC